MDLVQPGWTDSNNVTMETLTLALPSSANPVRSCRCANCHFVSGKITQATTTFTLTQFLENGILLAMRLPVCSACQKSLSDEDQCLLQNVERDSVYTLGKLMLTKS